MSALINERTFIDRPDRRIRLSSAQMGRTLNIGTNWTKLRIAIRYTFHTQPHPYEIKFAFGLCAGTNTGDLYSDDTTRYFLGVKTVGIATSARSGAAVMYYVDPCYKLSSGTTTSIYNATTYRVNFNVSTTDLYFYYITYDKSAANPMTHWGSATNTSYTPVNCTDLKFESALTATDPYSAIGANQDSTNATMLGSWPSQAFKDNLDTMCVSLESVNNYMEISEFAAYKFS